MPWLELYLYSISNNGYPANKEKLTNILDRAEQERFKRYKFDHSRWTFATARWIAKTQIARHLAALPATVSFKYNKNGKPFLPDNPNLHFSVSHTDTAIVIALSNSSIGVDVEMNNRRSEPWRNAKAFLNHDVAKIIGKVESEEEQKRLFGRYWTAMEARVKIHGDSLFNVKNDFGRGLPTLSQDGFVTDGNYAYYSATLATGEQMSICVEHKRYSAAMHSYLNGEFSEDKKLAQDLGFRESV